ncbi:MAG TPA: hypothetical protein VNO75_06110 [Gemmatimonadaceae bacterium]|nr:hypothetical protein [Gemmatimonadaceae bacterium]
MSHVFRDEPEPPLSGGPRRLHFGCGVLLGLVAGWIFAIRVGRELGMSSPWIFGLIIGAVALAFGMAAARWGDRFWSWVTDRR